MNPFFLGFTVAATSIILNSWLFAVGLDSRSVSFDQAPTLSRVDVTGNQMTYFTITIPEDAGENLAKLSLSEQAPRPQSVPFNLETTTVFAGTPETIGNSIGIQGAWLDETGVIWISFVEPVQAGTTLTIAFEGTSDPAERYEYGIAAYPAAENAVPAFVGSGTLLFK